MVTRLWFAIGLLLCAVLVISGNVFAGPVDEDNNFRLEIVKQGPSEVTTGDEIVYTLTALNKRTAPQFATITFLPQFQTITSTSIPSSGDSQQAIFNITINAYPLRR